MGRVLVFAAVASLLGATLVSELNQRLFASQPLSQLATIAVVMALVAVAVTQLARRPAQRLSRRPAPRTRAAGEPVESGTVKWFNRKKGFGFIVRESGGEVFVHHRAIVAVNGDRRPSLRDGQRVTFVVVEHNKGLQAERVSPDPDR